MLTRRAIDPRVVDTHELARAITQYTDHPVWARYRGDADEARRWVDTGHSVILPVYDHDAKMRSVRAWRIVRGDDAPKRLPPAGCKATGLVLANGLALRMLRGETGPCRVVIVEGEPDYLSVATRWHVAVIGVLSGSWSEDFAGRLPFGVSVVIRTHCDKAGDRYADTVTKTIVGRGEVRRLVA